mmetsp:Transcript_11768/g.19368  ORF Transcript_11768/g.19368 Transcript_11768/m.19368 type:complete len:94 (+) Transcript_11768:405-686(+)
MKLLARQQPRMDIFTAWNMLTSMAVLGTSLHVAELLILVIMTACNTHKMRGVLINESLAYKQRSWYFFRGIYWQQKRRILHRSGFVSTFLHRL